MSILRELRQSYRRRAPLATSKGKIQLVFHTLWLHIHPVKVHKSHFRFTYTWYLGFASFYLFLILTVTGVALMFYYRPSTALAYQDMKDLEFAVFLGKFIRNLHRWSAHAMIIVVVLHMYRVFVTGSYKKPRQFNWVIGVLLLLLTLLLSFTGYLLPWDQLAFWAITVGTSIGAYTPWLGPKLKELLLGGTVVGDAALNRFYVLHCIALPAAMAALTMVHFWRIRKDGGLSPPPGQAGATRARPGAATWKPSIPLPFSASWRDKPGAVAVAAPKMAAPAAATTDEDIVLAYPFAFYREGVALLATLLVMMTVSLVWDAPLEEMANPAKTPNPAKAPWYFLGIQELVSYSAFFGGVAAPALMVLALVALPYLDTSPARRPSERKLAIWVFTLVLLANLIFILIGAWFRGEGWKFVLPWRS
jgi:quinol-cytochrome oxidoreductase complex cytochrome b subunit